MKNTYTRTMMISNLEEAQVKVIVFEGCKYTDSNLGQETEINYTGLTSWDVISGEDAAEIESNLNDEEMDEYHEYFTLHFNDGTEATFRNSHCNLFIR